LRAGPLRNRVTIQTPTVTQDGQGASVTTWATLVKTYAAIWPLRGKEFFEAQQLGGEISHRVRLRYYPGLSIKDRILWGSRYLKINSIINLDERNAELEMMCTEEV